MVLLAQDIALRKEMDQIRLSSAASLRSSYNELAPSFDTTASTAAPIARQRSMVLAVDLWG